jgi:WD40 repeat protein
VGSRDGQWLVSGNGPVANCGSGFRYEPTDHVVRVHTVSGGGPVAVLASDDVETIDVAFSGDGQWLAASSLDGAVRLWQVSTWSSTPAASKSMR